MDNVRCLADKFLKRFRVVADSGLLEVIRSGNLPEARIVSCLTLQWVGVSS